MNTMAAFESSNNGAARKAGSWNRDLAGGSPLRERLAAQRYSGESPIRNPSDPEQYLATRTVTSPNRLSNDALLTFENQQKERFASQLANVDHLPADATECFEHPTPSPRRPLRPAGKLPSFAMRVFAPRRTASQDKLPPAFARFQVGHAAAAQQQQQRKWKIYRPKPEQQPPAVPEHSVAECGESIV
jgi:hypothetical protein